MALGFWPMFLSKISLMFQDVNSLSDEQSDEPAPKAATERKKPGRKPAQPKEKSDAAGESTKPTVKKPAAKAKGKAKAKAKAKGKAGRPKKNDNAKTVAKTKKTEERETEETEETPETHVDPTDNEEEKSSKAPKKAVLKRPAASATTGSSPPMKRPSAANAPLRVWKYQYGSGVYGFKDSRVNKEVLRVGFAKFVSNLMLLYECVKQIHFR